MLLTPLFGRQEKKNATAEYLLIVSLGEACISRDYDRIRECLSDERFTIDDSVYVYSMASRDKNDLIMNASAFLMRCGVASGSANIAHLLTLETSPDAYLDPGAMRNLALQDALLTGDRDLVYALASDARVSCPEKYRPGKLYSLHEFSDAELVRYISEGWEIFAGDSTPLALQIMQSTEFRAALLKPEIFDLEDLPVRRTLLHIALLMCFRRTKKREFAQALCLASSQRERNLKAQW